VVNENESQTGPPPLHQHERPFTDEELRELRGVLEADRRMKWLMASARIGAIWLAAIVGTVSLLWDSVVRFVLHVVGK
jgi:hypothetical protein